jgi:hypothetical protein
VGSISASTVKPLGNTVWKKGMDHLTTIRTLGYAQWIHLFLGIAYTSTQEYGSLKARLEPVSGIAALPKHPPEYGG